MKTFEGSENSAPPKKLPAASSGAGSVGSRQAVTYKYTVAHTLVPPTDLKSSALRLVVKFALTKKQARSFTRAHRVHLRLYVDYWHLFDESPLPNGITLNVNDSFVEQPNWSRESDEHFIDITSMLSIFHSVENTLKIAWPADCATKIPWHHVAVFIERRLTIPSMLVHMEGVNLVAPSVTREDIKMRLKHRNEYHQYIMSLHCSSGDMRFIFPARAKECTHFECFDAAYHWQVNQAVPIWKCPICGTPATMAELNIDGYFIEVLKSPHLKPGDMNVHLFRDGSWRRVGAEEDRSQLLVLD